MSKKGKETPQNGMPEESKPRKKIKRVRQTGDLEGLKRKLWQAIVAAEEIYLDEEVEASNRLRAVTAMTQAAMAFARLLGETEVADRVAKLEASLKRPDQQGPSGRPRDLPPDDLGDDEVWAEENAANAVRNAGDEPAGDES